MIVECSSEDGVQLAEPFDFRRFKLVLKGTASTQSRCWLGITFVDEDNALVPIDLVPTLRGRPTESCWEPAYIEMVEKAREHGWVDAERSAIRIHVERQP
jgi:hypothetical protein